LRRCFRQKLEGHEASQRDVLRLVDHAHPAGAQFLENPVPGKRRPQEAFGYSPFPSQGARRRPLGATP
jgi:hypothetical protein